MDTPDFPLQFTRTHRFTLGAPRSCTVSQDGERVLFLRSTGGEDPVNRLWVYEGGAERIVADAAVLNRGGTVPEAERVRRERARESAEGVVAYATDRHARVVAFSLGGALWVVTTDGGIPQRIPTAGPAFDPRPSPDGSVIAYVAHGSLRVVGADGTDDRLLAAPEDAAVTYGLADHTAAESIGRHRGYWWAPDGSAVLAARVDLSPVTRWYLADPAHPGRPPRPIRYPATGTANARTSLHILGLDGERVDIRLPKAADPEHHPAGEWTDTAFEYVTSVSWDAHGPLVCVQSRDQRTEYTCAVDPETGATELLRRRRDPAWVGTLPGTPARTGSGTHVHPWAVDDTNGLKIGDMCTPPGLEVRAVLGTSGEQVLFTASEEPTEIHVWSYAPGHGFTRISEEPGTHTAALGGPTLVLQSSTHDGEVVRVLRGDGDADCDCDCGGGGLDGFGGLGGGKELGRIDVLTHRPLVRPAPAHLRLGKRELRSLLYLPTGHKPGAGPLPVLVNPYAGPALQLALRARTWHATVSQWFADQGFAVLVTDGRGTPGRGRAWERAIHGDQLTPVLDDQVTALHAAAEQYGDLDLDRVAIRGWSFGGYLAAGAVLLRPEVFHAASAGAAVADLRLYDTYGKERFLGHPEVRPDIYDDGSPITHAHRLTRPLLLMHGLADDNVVVAHMLRFSAALLSAGRPHSVLPLADASHRAGGEGLADTLLRHELDFLKKSLER
ncbi:prolyl oligopeptidase family serine peptidase [Streptomyces monticola]|uniref:Prolyl oligopeptidase family serine peptidase n=1 Tax=Streptomyces monticola TaxID=2666263 RepID=A0ABW2JYF1_9ACTN